jgi:hypothetical protein
MKTADHHAELESLMAYLDGELAGADAERVRGHLAACEQCQRVEAEMSEVSERLATWEVDDAPATFSSPRHAPRISAVRKWMPIAAALLITTGAGIAWLASQSDGPGIDRIELWASKSAEPPARAAAAGEVSAESAAAQASEATLKRQIATVALSDLMLARTARLTIVTDQFDAKRAELDGVIRTLEGFTGRILVTGTIEQGRALTATLQIPSLRLDEALGAIKALGRVTSEGVDGEDVTQQSVDLDARLANARNSEKRLTAILATRTGDLDDVLAVEREISRVRGEIESMEAQRKALDRRITYATVELQMTEEKRAAVDLGPRPLSSRFVDEFVRGWNGVLVAGIDLGLFAARLAPLALVLALLIAPVAIIRHRRAERAG